MNYYKRVIMVQSNITNFQVQHDESDRFELYILFFVLLY